MVEEKILTALGKPVAAATNEELYNALLDVAHDLIRARENTVGNKKLYYISAEFLTGRQLGRNLIVNFILISSGITTFKQFHSVLSTNPEQASG